MIVLQYSTAFKALDTYIDQFNHKTEVKTARLRSGAALTAREIIRIYGICLLKTNGLKDQDYKTIPPLQTNNKQLAKLVKCSSRSIQRYIHKLIYAGVILKKVFHGSNANYELLINPEILLIKERISLEKTESQFKEAVKQAKLNEAKPAFLASEKPNCLDTYTGNTRNILNKKIIEVGNSQSFTAKFIDLKAKTENITGNTGEIVQSSLIKKENIEKKSQSTGEIVSRVSQLEKIKIPPGTARDNSLSLCVNLFWMTARNLLYKQKDLTDNQVAIANRLIYKLYEPVETSKLDKIHLMYIERLVLVSKYLKKNPARYVTLPYQYFDVNNPNGFVGTKKWHEADRIRKKVIERELILSRTIRKYHNNEKLSPVKKKPQLQLFRECENTIGKLLDPQLTERFHAAVLNHETYREIRYNY